VNREFINKFLVDDRFVFYTAKSIIGLLFSISLIQFFMPGYLDMVLFPTEFVLTRMNLLVLIIASLSLIVGSHTTFNIYFGLPYIIIDRWLRRRDKNVSNQ
jgi:hypothetical protein